MGVKCGAQYSCVWCGMPSLTAGMTELCCGHCSRSYPIVDEIPVLTARPQALLKTEVRACQSLNSQIGELAAVLENAPGNPKSQKRGKRVLDGMRANAALIESHMRTAALKVRETGTDLNFLDRISSCASGWSADGMLQYFYQDWAPTEDFERVKALIVETLLQHRPDHEAVTVLGAGACGLVQATAAEFSRAYGVDLSLPTLLIARSVLAGREIVVHLDGAEWAAISVRNADATKSNAQLLVADVVNLPFPSNSLSAVVTQYLMDIIGDPLQVAIEIERILKPGGVWVNFSLPMLAPVLPQEFGSLTLEELPVFFGPAGFEFIESRRERFTIMNLEKIYAEGRLLRNSVDFFTARKVASTRRYDVKQAIALSNEETWWRNVPRFATGRRAEISSVAEFSSDRQSRRFEASFGFWSDCVASRYTLDEVDAARIKAVVELIDNTRTYIDIYDTITMQGFEISRSDFRELIHYLSDRLGLVSVAT